MPIGGITTNYAQAAMQSQAQVASTLSQMTKDYDDEEKTIGGAIQASAGAALAGSVIPGWGAPVGAITGAAMYFLS